MRADRPQSFHIEGVMFQIRNVNGSSPFPEDRGWKDTVWVDGQVELLVYYAQPSWPHFPFQYLSQTLELADRGSIGQMLVNPAVISLTSPAHGQGLRKSSFISTIIPAYNPRPFGYFLSFSPEAI